MELEELVGVWTLRERLESLRRKLRTLKDVAIKPKLLDNMPRSCARTSVTERLAIKTTDIETAISRLTNELLTTQVNLLHRIQSAHLSKTQERVIIYRYVICLEFDEISRRLRYTPEHVGRVHSKALTNLLTDSEK